ncbi:MAG: HU family DNA-binding protein [Ignavibacteriae bacterium]|nr:HU family DNA-binding protein [Ignavibacteriota bacterium]
MTKKELILKIARETGLNIIDVSQFTDSVFTAMENSFKKGKNVNLIKFGKFSVAEKRTGAGIKKIVTFSPVKKFADDVNYNFENLESVKIRIPDNIHFEKSVSAGREIASDSDESDESVFIEFVKDTDSEKELRAELFEEETESNLSLTGNITDTTSAFSEFEVSEISASGEEEVRTDVPEEKNYTALSVVSSSENLYAVQSSAVPSVITPVKEEISVTESGLASLVNKSRTKIIDFKKSLFKSVTSFFLKVTPHYHHTADIKKREKQKQVLPGLPKKVLLNGKDKTMVTKKIIPDLTSEAFEKKIETPAVEEIQLPAVEEIHIPVTEEIQTPAVEEIHIPVTEETPAVEEIQTPVAEEIPVTEDIQIPVTEDIQIPVTEETPAAEEILPVYHRKQNIFDDPKDDNLDIIAATFVPLDLPFDFTEFENVSSEESQTSEESQATEESNLSKTILKEIPPYFAETTDHIIPETAKEDEQTVTLHAEKFNGLTNETSGNEDNKDNTIINDTYTDDITKAGTKQGNLPYEEVNPLYHEKQNIFEDISEDEFYELDADIYRNFETIIPESIVPEKIVPEEIIPETITPETVVPEKIIPETVVPETIVSETIISEKIVPETIVPEKTVPDTIVPENDIFDSELEKVLEERQRILGEIRRLETSFFDDDEIAPTDTKPDNKETGTTRPYIPPVIPDYSEIKEGDVFFLKEKVQEETDDLINKIALLRKELTIPEVSHEETHEESIDNSSADDKPVKNFLLPDTIEEIKEPDDLQDIHEDKTSGTEKEDAHTKDTGTGGVEDFNERLEYLENLLDTNLPDISGGTIYPVDDSDNGQITSQNKELKNAEMRVFSKLTTVTSPENKQKLFSGSTQSDNMQNTGKSSSKSSYQETKPAKEKKPDGIFTPLEHVQKFGSFPVDTPGTTGRKRHKLIKIISFTAIGIFLGIAIISLYNNFIREEDSHTTNNPIIEKKSDSTAGNMSFLNYPGHFTIGERPEIIYREDDAVFWKTSVGITIQFGAFTTVEPAQLMVEKLREKNVMAMILKILNSDRSLSYWVIAGPYRTQQEAINIYKR